MTTEMEQAAATVAMLRARRRGQSWASIATDIWLEGDAVSAWREFATGSALVEDPRHSATLDEARDDVLRWRSDGLRLLTVLDKEYPSRLRDIREMPPFVFASGRLMADDCGMSVVGSRKASAHGHRFARAAAEILVSKGMSVIAGLAAGIDTTAHRTALERGGRTVAFIGTGIMKYYPAENRQLQDEVAEQGLVLSQFWPDAPPSKASFPIRNAAMSGYGMGTIVVEASETSGTRIQARLALEHGRPVILTDQVVRSTHWGAALAERPGVYVVSGTEELDQTIDEVVRGQSRLGEALRQLGSFDPAAA